MTVADEGPEVPDDRKEAIFERDDKGGRLGLYLARTLVSRYGGAIRVTDNDLTGAVFELSFPTATPPDGDGARSDPDTSTDSEVNADSGTSTDADADTRTAGDDGNAGEQAVGNRTADRTGGDDAEGDDAGNDDTNGDGVLSRRSARLRSVLGW